MIAYDGPTNLQPLAERHGLKAYRTPVGWVVYRNDDDNPLNETHLSTPAAHALILKEGNR